MKRFILILLFTVAQISFGQTNLFNQANTLYNQGDYLQAISVYNKILNNNEHSAQVYFNIGNAYYKLNKIAPSIYNYERALLLEPNNKIIKQNLEFANNMKIDKIDVLPEIGINKLMNSYTRNFHLDGLAYLIIGLVCLGSTAFIIYLFTSSTQKKRILFITGIITFIIAGLTLGATYKKYTTALQYKTAIVFAKESKVKSEPNLKSSENFKLHEGTKINIIDHLNEWSQIKIANGKTGWLITKDIKTIASF